MTADTDRTILLPGGVPKCPECGRPTFLVTEGPDDGVRPWWCPDCNTRVEDGESPNRQDTETDR